MTVNRIDYTRAMVTRCVGRWQRLLPGVPADVARTIALPEVALASLIDMLVDDLDAMGLESAASWRRNVPEQHNTATLDRGWWYLPADWELAQRSPRGTGGATASVWLNGTWHTFSRNGIGGENGREDTVEAAKRAAEAALIRQGWAKPQGGG